MEELRNFTMKQLSEKLALDPPEFANLFYLERLLSAMNGRHMEIPIHHRIEFLQAFLLFGIREVLILSTHTNE